MEDYEIVEDVERIWPNIPKGLPYVRSKARQTWVGLAHEAHGLWVLHQVIIGARGGLTEQFIIINPDKAIVADRLLCGVAITEGGLHLQLAQLRGECQSLPRDRRIERIKQALLEAKETWIDPLSREGLETEAIIQASGKQQVDTVPGCYGGSLRSR